MEIINLSLTEGVLTLELNSNDYSKIYLDTISNKDNVYSNKDELHSIVINNEPTVEEPEEPVEPEIPETPVEPDPEDPDPSLPEDGGESEEDDNSAEVIPTVASEDTTVSNIIEIKDLSEAIYVVTIIGQEQTVAVAIDENAVYLAKINLVTSYCNTCLDKQQKEMIIMCDFKSQLLDYAVSNNYIDDTIQLCYELSKILKLNTHYTHCKNNKTNNCVMCKNGYCQLC